MPRWSSIFRPADQRTLRLSLIRHSHFSPLTPEQPTKTCLAGCTANPAAEPPQPPESSRGATAVADFAPPGLPPEIAIMSMGLGYGVTEEAPPSDVRAKQSLELKHMR